MIKEKVNTLIVFIDVENMRTICDIADSIEDKFPESVIEVTYNWNAKQGSIILYKEKIDIEIIEKLFI